MGYVMARQTTLKENTFDLEGPELKVGDTAPEVTLLSQTLEPVSLSSYAGQVRIISSVPSLDTPVCADMARRFNEEASKLPDTIAVSADLPFAQARFCGAENVDKIQILSDHQALAFGKAYGTFVPALRVNSRAVFVIDGDNRVVHAEYVLNIPDHPDYDAALSAARSASGQ